MYDGQLAAHFIEVSEPGRDLAPAAELQHRCAEVAGAYPPVPGQLQGLDGGLEVQLLRRGLVAPEQEGRGVGRVGVLPAVDFSRGQAELYIALPVVAQVGQVVPEKSSSTGSSCAE